MEKNFVNDFYTKSGKNSLNSNVKDEISKAYLNYATILVERNKINTSKFEKQLSDEDVRNLNSEEIKYYNCIKKVYEYTPDLESKIRYWTATGTRLATKAIATFFTAKAAISSKSRIVSLGAGVGAVATGVSTISDTSNVVEQFFTLDLGNRKEIHKKERNGKLSLFKKFTRNLKKIFNKFRKFSKFNNKRIIIFDGDAAAVMHMGSLATNCRYKARNMIHIVLNNGVNESVGGQESAGRIINLTGIANACGYNTPTSHSKMNNAVPP